MKARALSVLGLVMFLSVWSQAALAGPALDSVRSSVDEVLGILTSTKPGAPGRTEKLDVSIRKIFDPEELAKRTLATNWESFSPEERTRFTAAFVRLLEHTYLRRIEAYTNEQVVFLNESSLGENRAEVSTKVVTSTKEVPIVYRLIKKSDWKVYDVVIEGVSLVQNYRNQFNQILAKETPAQLIGRVESMSSAS